MKRLTTAVYQKMFGRLPPSELLEPVTPEEWRDNREIIQRREEKLRDFLGASTNEDAFKRIARLVFPGIDYQKNTRYRHDEVVQFAALISLGTSVKGAAIAIARRQARRGRNGKPREWPTIKRDYESTGLYRSFGDWIDPAQVALVQSGLLDKFAAAAREHKLKIIFFPEFDDKGIGDTLGPLQASLIIAAGPCERSDWRCLSRRAILGLLECRNTAEVAVVDAVNGNAGPCIRDSLAQIGLERVPLLERMGPLAEIEAPTVVIFKNTIPETVRRTVDAHLEKRAREQSQLLGHTGGSLSAHQLRKG